MVERVNCTLKSKLYRYFTGVNSLCYIDVLRDIVDSYNNTYHRSIGCAPVTVSLLNLDPNQNASSLKWVIMSDLVYINDSSRKGIK